MKNVFKKAVSVILCLVVAVGLYPINAYAADTSKKNEYTLEANVARKDKIQNQGEINWYTFTMPEDGSVSFDFSPDMVQLIASKGGSFNVNVYDVDYNKLDSVIYSKNAYTTDNYNFVKGTVFYVSVETSYGNQGVGVEYSLIANYHTLDNWEIEDLAAPRKVTTLSNKTATHGNMYCSKDEDVFQYKVPANGPTKFVFGFPKYDEKAIQYGWQITISDANNTEICSNKVKTKYTSQILNFKKGTTLRVTVKSYFPSAAPVGVEYTLTPQTTASSSWEVEGNDSFAKATKITSKKKGTLYKFDDSDYYVYKAAGSKCQVKLTSNDSTDKIKNGWRVRVYDKNKKLIKDFYTNSASSATFKTKKNQKYYIVISSSVLTSPVDAIYTLTCKKK